MSTLWATARALGDLLLAPFLGLPPSAGLLLLSAACGLFFLLAFRALTPQAALRRTKDQMSATIYEMRIWSHAPGRVLVAQGRALGLTLRYLALALPSFVLLVPLLGLLVGRATPAYEFRALEPGEAAIVQVSLGRAVPRGDLALETTGGGLELRPPLLLDPDGREAYIRVVPRVPGTHLLRVRVGAEVAEKQVQAGRPSAALSLARAPADDWLQLWSHEAALPGGGAILRLAVDYPSEPLTWLGLPWYLVLLVVSMAVALLLRRRLGVVI